MKFMQPFQLINAIVCLLFFQSCKKQDTRVNECFKNVATTRQVISYPATVTLISDQYYLVEQNTIDTRLLPCNLAPEFRIDKLRVIITGDVKGNADLGMGACCTENFVIKTIVR